MKDGAGTVNGMENNNDGEEKEEDREKEEEGEGGRSWVRG